MTVEWRIEKEPIPKNTPPMNKLVMLLDYEFGDADGYDDEKFTFDPADEAQIKRLTRDFEALHLYRNATESESEFKPIRRMITPGMLKLGYTEAEIDRFMDNYAKGDPMSDFQFAASLVNISVTYFDPQGDEYPVTMILNGKELSN